MPNKKKPTTKTKQSTPKTGDQPHRKAVVFVSLVGVLTLTTALLLALSPDPLRAGPTGPTLLNTDRTVVAPVAQSTGNQKPTYAGQ